MTELETWFQTFWSTYPRDLCHRKLGSKKKAFEIIQKISPDKDLQDKILGNLRELVRFYRLEAKAQGKTDRWPMVTTWLNGECWQNLEDIGSYSDQTDAIAAKTCKCGGHTDIQDKCWTCYDSAQGARYDEELKAELRRIGLWKTDEETVSDWQQRCRLHLLKTTGLGRALARRATANEAVS